MVLFLLEALGALSPDLDFFVASDSRDSSNFFRALITQSEKKKIKFNTNHMSNNALVHLKQNRLQPYQRKKLGEGFLPIPLVVNEDCS